VKTWNYANQSESGEARVAGSYSGGGGNAPLIQNLVNDSLVLDTGNHPGLTATLWADRNIDKVN
jgi:hypothetical protein